MQNLVHRSQFIQKLVHVEPSSCRTQFTQNLVHVEPSSYGMEPSLYGTQFMQNLVHAEPSSCRTMFMCTQFIQNIVHLEHCSCGTQFILRLLSSFVLDLSFMNSFSFSNFHIVLVEFALNNFKRIILSTLNIKYRDKKVENYYLLNIEFCCFIKSDVDSVYKPYEISRMS